MMLFYCSAATNSDLSTHNIFDVNKMDMNVNKNHSIVPRSDYSTNLIADQ